MVDQPDASADEPVRLTSLSRGAGCGCKLPPEDLATVFGLLHPMASGAPPDPRLLVGFGTNDDAAVYAVRDDLALVFTTDFFTPIVDDPYVWGRIAATNALSDVYAMGGRPLLALNLVGWPRDTLPLDLLARVLDGGATVAAENGCLVVGGHSIDDAEPKFGLAVIGTVHPDAVRTNAGGRPGDVLILTKPIGVGAVATAAKLGRMDDARMAGAVALMTASNGPAAEAFANNDSVHAVTDVTGFGLMGHLREMALASGLAATIELATVPVLDGVRGDVAAGAMSGGARRNCRFVDATTSWDECGDVDRLVLADPQTSGGLLIACNPAAADELVARIEQAQDPVVAVIGRLDDGVAGHITVRA